MYVRTQLHVRLISHYHHWSWIDIYRYKFLNFKKQKKSGLTVFRIHFLFRSFSFLYTVWRMESSWRRFSPFSSFHLQHKSTSSWVESAINRSIIAVNKSTDRERVEHETLSWHTSVRKIISGSDGHMPQIGSK